MFGRVEEVKLIAWGGGNRRGGVCLRDRGKWRRGQACILQRRLNMLSAQRSVGGLGHLPMVSENDKAGKVRKKKGGGRTTSFIQS